MVYMPGREIPLITSQIYHVINRGVASQPVFINRRDYQRALEAILYYQYQKPHLRYSFFLRLTVQQRRDFLNKLKLGGKRLIEIIAYCLMPNHLHLLLRQRVENGISIFMSNFTNSYTRYFNTKQKRKGHLFQGKFKAVRVETDQQLIHLSRYIHLNPYASFVLKTPEELEFYSYSSLPEYLSLQREAYCNKEPVLDHFKNRQFYKKFVFDQSSYQRELEKIKHLALEE